MPGDDTSRMYAVGTTSSTSRIALKSRLTRVQSSTLTLSSALHEFPHPHRLLLGQSALKFQIQLQPWQPQHMRQEQLSL